MVAGMTGEQKRHLSPRLSKRDRQLLATPDGKATLARIDSAVGEFCAVPRDQHVRRIALICLNARSPINDPPPASTDLARDQQRYGRQIGAMVVMTRNSGSKCCARCGKRQPRERLVHSPKSKKYFCSSFDACESRTKKKAVKRNPALAQLRAEAEHYYNDKAYRESLPWSEPVAA
jgi:hypothetical protein